MNHLKFISFLVLLSSCVEVGFRNPQPEKGKVLDKFPEDMVAFFTEQGKDSTNDESFKISDLGEELNEDGTLSENMILKSWKGRYFLNQKEDSLWYIIMIVPTKNETFDAYKMDGGDENTVKTLKEITHVEEVYSETGELKLIIIDPSTSEFKKIIKSGAFEKIDIF